jgi:predicted dehydrogenase
MNQNRREFVGATTAASLIYGLGVAPYAKAAGPKKYRTALIGCGWWGSENILTEAMASGQSKVVALCDVDPDALDVTAETVEEISGDKPKKYMDFRDLFAKEDIEIAIVATPDHWHALPTIAAIEAGAHVFVEKPTSHTIQESRAMLNAARQANRVVQVGLHRRIGPHHVSGIDFLKSGAVGEVGQVRMFVAGKGGPEAPTRNSAPPEGMDWDMYCGPAPLRPFNRKIHPGGFRNFLDFGNGTLGDWGTHWLDQVMMWTDEKFPKRVYSTGGRPIRGAAVFNDKEQTSDAPDSQVAVYEFENFTATWEHRKYAANASEKHSIGCYFYGTKGVLHIGWRDGWTFYPVANGAKEIHQEAQLQQPDGHNMTLLWADFLKSIENGTRPVADIEAGHYSTNMALLGMMSYKLGRSIEWDGARERVIGDEAANKLLRREYRGEWVYPEV